MKKYGKPVSDLFQNIKIYIRNNAVNKKKINDIDTLYKQQKHRNACIICNSELPQEYTIKRFDINYFLCPTCGHLNGEYCYNEQFVNQIYLNNKEQYAEKFLAEDEQNYLERTNTIYKPKAQFLLNSLKDENISNPSIVDFGCGSGHFIRSLLDLNITNVTGLEVSEAQVNYANAINHTSVFKTFNIAQYISTIKSLECDVLSMIGVLEHLIDPIKAIEAIQQNKNIKYFFFSVPLFSLASILQIIFPHCMERQLGATHTHLFTKESIQYICHTYDLKILSEWWFGTDFADLYRGILVSSAQNEKYKIQSDTLDKYLLSSINDLQAVLDKNEICSEVHILVKNKE